MLEAYDTKKLSYDKLTKDEMNKRGILGRLSGVIADGKNPTRNGRKYSKKLWENVFENPIVREAIDNRLCLGELGHPEDRTETDMEKICICLNGYPKINKDDQLIGNFDILDTPNGRILNTLCNYGANIGVSSRGEGDLYTDDYGDECVQEDTYQFQCFDAVIIPAVEAARMNYMTESLSNKKSLTEALNKELNNASDNDRRIMLETLEHLGLNEGKDAINSTVNHFGTVDEPPYNITYIMRDGSFLDLSGCKHHADVEQWLVDNNLSNRDFNNNCGSPTLFDEGCIRADMNKYCITLCDNQPKRPQYEALIDWIDDLFTHTRIVTVVTPDGKQKDYSKDKFTADDIVDSIRKYYFTGDLVESKVTESPYRKSIKETYKVTRNEEGQFEVADQEGNVIKKVNNKDSALNIAKKLEYNNTEPEEDNGPDEDEPLDIPEPEVDNDESMMEELQEALSDKRKLQKKLMEVQKELSVSNAKESEYKETIQQLKEAIAKLSVNTKRVSGLETRVTQLSEALQKSNDTVAKYQASTKTSDDEKVKLKESISSKNTMIQNLTDQIKSKEDTLGKQNATLKEDLNKAKGNLTLLKEKLDKQEKLVEKYKKISTACVDKYIESKAQMIGTTSAEIKNRLPESYNFNDIDRIVEELRSYKVNMSKLPFDLNRTSNIGVKRSKNESLSRRPRSNDWDEDLTSLYSLAGLEN